MATVACARFWRTSTIVLAMGMVSACTVASDHTAVIKQFATATASAKDAIVAYDAAAAASLTANIRRKAVAQKIGIDPSNTGTGIRIEGCQLDSTECKATYREESQGKGESLTYTEIMPGHTQAALALGVYADALKQVAEADSRMQVKAALDQAAAATAALANFQTPGSSAVVQPLAGAKANALAFLYGKYQEKVKINALRAATQRMNPEIKEVADVLGDAAAEAASIVRIDTMSAIAAARHAFIASPSDGTINDLAATVNSLNQQFKVSPEQVFQDLAESHQKLTDALVEEPDSFAEVFAAVNRLAADAQTLAGIAMQLQAAEDARNAAKMMMMQ